MSVTSALDKTPSLANATVTVSQAFRPTASAGSTTQQATGLGGLFNTDMAEPTKVAAMGQTPTFTLPFLSALKATHLSIASYDDGLQAAVRASVPNGAVLSESAAFNKFNHQLLGAAPAARADFFRRAFEASKLEPSSTADAGVALGGFLSRTSSIQEGDLVGPAHTKPAHKIGVSGLARTELEGQVPAELQGVEQAVVRLGPGKAGGLPGFSLGLLGPDQNRSIVFMSFSGHSYGETLSTRALGITTRGSSDRDLTFVPSDALKGLDLQNDSKPSNDWMVAAGKIKSGTVLGTVTPDNGDSWKMTVKADGELSQNQFGERSLRFKRDLAGANFGGSILLGMIKFASWFT